MSTAHPKTATAVYAAVAKLYAAVAKLYAAVAELYAAVAELYAAVAKLYAAVAELPSAVTELPFAVSNGTGPTPDRAISARIVGVKNRILGLLAILIVAGGVTGSAFFLHSYINPEMSDGDLAKTKAFCGGIAVPSSFHKLSEHNLIKNDFAIFDTNYSSETDPSMVEAHFSRIFPQDQWTKERESDSEGVSLRFQEGQTRVTLRYYWFELTSDHHYVVICSFNQ
jgi:hypothetical protein